MRIGALILGIAVLGVATIDTASAQRWRYYEPPCEPGKHRVIINGNSQCVYGRGHYRRGYGYGNYRPGPVVGAGPAVRCPPGKVRVWDPYGGGQCY